MTSSIYTVCARPRPQTPEAVRGVRMSPALLELYLVIRDRSEFVAVLDEVLPAGSDRALTLEAVEARFEALAAWALDTEPSDRPAGATDWRLICRAIAETALEWDGRVYRFDCAMFRRALERARRGQAEV